MNNTDPTSFQSILAGVQKLREENGGNESQPQIQKPPANKAQINVPPTNEGKQHVINSFNQQRPSFQYDNTNNQQNGKRQRQDQGLGKTVLVNTTQKENPLLDNLKNTNWRYVTSKGGSKIYYDYLIKGRSVLFLTLSYHKLYADYITRRMAPLSKDDNNILIFVVDGTNSEEAINDITKMCMFNGFTFLVAFNFEQAAKYIEYLNAA
ncbi:similar to Saccharomyces cerevisiae YML095C RAD10 Single-stranded DNA endonuclease (with Rad1p), cleaves single-stranded DNA during nucleotide excision repair and double-strand break repair [Maudiozyma barnettii]|uniref:Similar to Saccharomyces cerevisiae YML095C RAD10 Single-stranded DNA endonuclease (With Rad1p), cleaves single-stranded DNA during nucleotide excision repair and double-strand break repair n=1 Tax=Maudiozyma barnettii TaxID=61262 RepID=A0A8H2ZGQ3_9SACH|nr:DNA repair protein RAD10 [Kazachstania barnettii]CAB4252980.1 similar to Saccharomyces cerevisiae YML095C RAD10 Single-stranded DNA endonuclease (with Rad1p), cleaves single-stranded DNA during nucleotide excision repair and double-strand break repair [Kazachstania barnettii]CAD1780780.1 similar to Saccharomyces cerevisiae YML095C RAD10 Single-stranded DNA endonuclease (with Rad1p), cleaves single-stranded DNA during nucleotide excision repair and double-strand break repair [Kazachstania barne